MFSGEYLYLVGLNALKGAGVVLARHMLHYFGSAEEIFKAKRSLLEKVPGIGSYTAEQIEAAKTGALRRAEKELVFIDKNKINLYACTDDNYPERLKECQDAPVVIYYRGSADLNATKIISIVGTRRITAYGREWTEAFVNDLAGMFPDIIIVSGLAYGVDICAHRSALKNRLHTVGVLAHGLDRIYPAVHRNTAVEMLDRGGLVTEFMSGTNPDRENFPRRNRIIAGLSDATVVVESAERGGSLVTADIAFSYGREVYACPGRATDVYSAGCNRLIQMNKAGLINSAKDFVMSLCWDVDVNAAGRQYSLSFPERPDHPIIRLLVDKGEFHINQLALEMNLSVQEIMPMLFELELGGHIKVLPGGIYKLC
jgi:DNA processing protein